MSELKQIKKVEKWEARDGTFHDSLEAAQTHQLMRDLKDALGACKGREEDQARHLLAHFNIVRKGDTPKGFILAPIPVTKPRVEYRGFWVGFAFAACLSIIFAPMLLT